MSTQICCPAVFVKFIAVLLTVRFLLTLFCYKPALHTLLLTSIYHVYLLYDAMNSLVRFSLSKKYYPSLLFQSNHYTSIEILDVNSTDTAG